MAASPKPKVLVAGATGYLGRHIVAELVRRGYPTRAVVRDAARAAFAPDVEVVEAQVTDASALPGVLAGVDVVLSAVGITRQRDGLTYMDVDYGANKKLLDAAKAAGAKKFIYVGVINGERLRHVKLVAAKERFCDELRESGLAHCVVRPTGFYSDMKDFLDMAQAGRVYLFGSGEQKLNPIHGADLAEVCVDCIEGAQETVEVGGPETFTHNELAELALRAKGKPIKVTHLPDWTRRASISIVRTFCRAATSGPIEFFLSAMADDAVGAPHGTRKLGDFFASVVAEEEKEKKEKEDKEEAKKNTNANEKASGGSGSGDAGEETVKAPEDAAVRAEN